MKGINADIFAKIKPFVTAFGSGAVNINTASKGVLLALGLKESLVDKVLKFRQGEDAEERTSDDRTFMDPNTVGAALGAIMEISVPETVAIGNLISVNKLGTVSTHFRVQSHAVLNKNGAALDMESVIDLKGKIYYLWTSKIQWLS